MSSSSLRHAANLASAHGQRCDETARLLELRSNQMAHLFAPLLRLHIPQTWNSPTATVSRDQLITQAREFEATRAEINRVARSLRHRADTDFSDAAQLRRQADHAAIQEANTRREQAKALTTTAPN
jgi:hypothetical protein